MRQKEIEFLPTTAKAEMKPHNPYAIPIGMALVKKGTDAMQEAVRNDETELIHPLCRCSTATPPEVKDFFRTESKSNLRKSNFTINLETVVEKEFF